MSSQNKEQIFNSKELNMILPSYLLDEIDKEDKKDLKQKIENEFNELSISKVSKKKVRNNNYYFILIIQDVKINNSSNNNSFVNKGIKTINSEKRKNHLKINNYQNGQEYSKYFLKAQKTNYDSSNQEQEKNSDENKNPLNYNSKLLSKIIQNVNQKTIIANEHNMNNNLNGNIYNNFLLNINNIPGYNYNISNYNNIISNNITNYNNLINQMSNNDKLFNNNDYNKLPFSLTQKLNKEKTNLISYNNKINNFNFVPNINLVNNSQLGFNINNFHNISAINNLSDNLFLNSKAIEISNPNNNINYCNSFNEIDNNCNNDNQLNNNIKYLNNIHNNFLNNNLNNNIINDNLNNSFKIINTNNNSPNSHDSTEGNSLTKENNLDTSYTEDFLKFINSLSVPLVKFLCTPKGTLEIRKKLGKPNSESKILLIKALGKEGISTIMKNTYGNYFFQQMIKGTEEIIISLIISYISSDFIQISKDSCGTFSVQALLNEVSSINEEQEILNCIKGYEMEMAFNINATYVLQKIVLLFPDIHRIYLNEIILNNFKDLCLDSNGICLIKNFIKTNTLINNKIRINDEIKKNFVVLAESPFGNYGIQYLMDNWNKNELNDMKKKILENVYKLSVQQYSSNVVEKGIEIFDEESREKIIKKLCFEGNFILLLKNKFGRYVLNKAINYMRMNLKNEFEIFLINNINNNVYCHKDKNKVKKLLMKINNKNKSGYGIDLSKGFLVSKKGSNICNYNFYIKNNENNFFENKNYFL